MLSCFDVISTSICQEFVIVIKFNDFVIIILWFMVIISCIFDNFIVLMYQLLKH